MSSKAMSNNQTTPADILEIENALRQKRIDTLNHLARTAWAGGDENASIRFRYEWQAAVDAMDLPIDELRRSVESTYGSDRQWEELSKQIMEEKMKEQEGCAS